MILGECQSWEGGHRCVCGGGGVCRSGFCLRRFAPSVVCCEQLLPTSSKKNKRARGGVKGAPKVGGGGFRGQRSALPPRGEVTTWQGWCSGGAQGTPDTKHLNADGPPPPLPLEKNRAKRGTCRIPHPLVTQNGWTGKCTRYNGFVTTRITNGGSTESTKPADGAQGTPWDWDRPGAILSSSSTHSIAHQWLVAFTKKGTYKWDSAKVNRL